MSAPLTKSAILFEQRLLACGGFYKGALDSLWGPKSEAAAQASLASYEALKKKYGALDLRSERNIATLLPKMQEKARIIMVEALKWGKPKGLTCQVLSGTRSYAEQDAIYAQGRSTKGNIVTNARGGQSNHNFAIAIDLGLFRGMEYLTGMKSNKVSAKQAALDSQAYIDLGKLITGLVEIDWGGNWKSTKDTPHYEYPTGLSISQKRAQFEKGLLRL